MLIFLCVGFVDFFFVCLFLSEVLVVTIGPSLSVTQTLLTSLGFRLLGTWDVSMIQSSVFSNMEILLE